MSPTDKIWYIILVGMFLCLLLWFNKGVALSSNHCTSVILEICIFCWHKLIYLVLVYIFDKYLEALWTGHDQFFLFFFFFFPYACPFQEWNRFLCHFLFLLVYCLFIPETKLQSILWFASWLYELGNFFVVSISTSRTLSFSVKGVEFYNGLVMPLHGIYRYPCFVLVLLLESIYVHC